jgi:hypothetical protein
MALFAYMQQVQRLIGDQKQTQVAPNDIITNINIARRHVAELTQSVRGITAVSGSITSLTVTAGGTGYTTTPTITVTAPGAPPGGVTNPLGVQATATATVAGGIITALTLTNAGTGYFQPTVAITDATGTSATAVASISSITQTNQGQEIYNFSAMPLRDTSGVGSIFAIKSVSVIYANQRFSLPCYSFSTYQAYVRQFPYQYTYVPTIMSQYGQGTNGSLYMYPIANSNYQFEADCFCLPTDLADDSTVEAIPLPWADSIPYYAAYLAFLELQRGNDARSMLNLFDTMLLRQSGAARSGRASNPYGRF